MLIIREKDFTKAREKIKKTKEPIVFSSDDDELNRKILEKEKIDFLLLNQAERRDKLKQRNSGLNHVLAKIAKKKNTAIGINLDEIIESKGKNKAEILARVMQNIKLCNKSKLKMKFITTNEKNNAKIKDFGSSDKMSNERNIKDLKSLGSVLGMPTWMTKNL